MASKRFLALLVLAAILGVVASLAAWCFLELVHQANVGAYQSLPDLLGFDSTPLWWSIPLLAIAGLIVAFAIHRMPGRGGHTPAFGLSTGQILPGQLPGVMLAGLATIGLGAVLGPEAPLIALGGGLAYLAVWLARRDVPRQTAAVVAAVGSFAAISTLLGTPLAGAFLLMEATSAGGVLATAAIAMPGRETGSGKPPAWNPWAGDSPPCPGRWRIVSPTSRPATASGTTGHHNGAGESPRPFGAATNAHCCTRAMSLRNQNAAAEIGTPSATARTSRRR